MLIINDIAAFIIEIFSVLLVVRWAYIIPEQMWLKISLSVAAAAGFALLWRIFFSPKAAYPLSGNLRWSLEFLILLFPYLQFLNKKTSYIIFAGIGIFINLFIQAKFGRSDF